MIRVLFAAITILAAMVLFPAIAGDAVAQSAPDQPEVAQQTTAPPAVAQSALPAVTPPEPKWTLGYCKGVWGGHESPFALTVKQIEGSKAKLVVRVDSLAWSRLALPHHNQDLDVVGEIDGATPRITMPESSSPITLMMGPNRIAEGQFRAGSAIKQVRCQ